MVLFIPSAKIVADELQGVGKLPAVIYPINQKIMFDYLYEQYKDICKKIVVTCFENADKVHQKLESYSTSLLEIRDLHSLGDLGDTLLTSICDAKDSAIINFADTMVLENLSLLNGNGFFYSEGQLSSTWTYFEITDGTICSITDKKEQRTTNCGKIFVGVFQFSHIEYLKQCLEKSTKNKDKSMNSFYAALLEYTKKYPMNAVKTDQWFDIGHLDKYYNSKLEVSAREFNHITIDKNRGILRKTSDDKDKFIGEIKWYLKLPKNIEYISPRIFGYSTDYKSPYIEMEYYTYHTIHELFLFGDLNKEQWVKIFSRIKFVLDDMSKFTLRDENIKQSLEDMYLIKTKQRLKQLKSNSNFTKFFTEKITVNGIQYIPLANVEEKLCQAIPKLLYDVDELSIIHGDLCFANILIDGNYSFIKTIDPRGKFGQYDIYGDKRYELAKLFHSVDGRYDYIIKDLFRLQYNLDNACIDFAILKYRCDFSIFDTFVNVFRSEIGDETKKIELIEALLFLSMIPLHGESIRHQLVMLGTGLEILNRVIDIRS